MPETSTLPPILFAEVEQNFLLQSVEKAVTETDCWGAPGETVREAFLVCPGLEDE